jgi:hypothetical protein
MPPHLACRAVFNQGDGIHQQLILGLRNGQQWPAMEWCKSSRS